MTVFISKMIFNFFFQNWCITLDPDPNWAKILDPDPSSMYLDPQHCSWLRLWCTFCTEVSVPVSLLSNGTDGTVSARVGTRGTSLKQKMCYFSKDAEPEPEEQEPWCVILSPAQRPPKPKSCFCFLQKSFTHISITYVVKFYHLRESFLIRYLPTIQCTEP